MIRLKTEKIKNKNYNIVSLGYNCFPRTLLTRYEIKKTKAQGELTLPFDLAAFATKEITASLRYDFKYFFDDLEYSKKEKYWIRKPDLIKFQHDKQFGADDKQLLIDKYKQRIENFYTIVNDPSPLIFVQVLGNDEDIDNLYLQLRRLRQQNKFVFCVIDPYKLTKKADERIRILKTPAPKGFYDNWWKPSCYNKKSSQEYETEIINFCIESLNNHLSA